MLTRPSKSDIPNDHLPPAPDNCLSLCFLRCSQLSSLTLAVLDKGLDSHGWSVFFEVFVVRVHLSELWKLHHVSNHIRWCIQYQFWYKNNDLVLERFFLVGWSVAIVHVDRNVDVKGLNDVLVVDIMYQAILIQKAATWINCTITTLRRSVESLTWPLSHGSLWHP